MSSIIHSQTADIPANMTTTGFDVPGFRIVDNLGVVRGVVVRSRSVFGTDGAALQTLFGGNISLFTELAERTRRQAFDTMLVQAHKAGADAVIGIRYDANELMKGVTEVLRSEEHTSELQSPCNLVCRLLLEKKKKEKVYTVLYV